MKWTALYGPLIEIKNDSQEIIFKGKKTLDKNNVANAMADTLICDTYFSGGKISADIMFEKIDTKFPTQCEIIIFFNPATGDLLTAGLGGSYQMYSIRSFTGQWQNHATKGPYSNLIKNRYYNVQVEVKGSTISLTVDGINVIVTNLPYTPSLSQVGIFCISTNKIHIKNYTVNPINPKAFVVMQFSSPFNELYSEVIKPACDEFNLSVLRADETYGPGLIVADIIKEINESKVVIAEISPTNPNVYYEVGYAHALNKPTILIAEKGTKLPFDVAPFRTLHYENTIAGKKMVEQGFRKHIAAVLEEKEKIIKIQS